MVLAGMGDGEAPFRQAPGPLCLSLAITSFCETQWEDAARRACAARGSSALQA